ncbi:hypothetical protein V1478_010447 [Vespula squamosa]|uniref:Uncharacterized protein n=1 Tax=Vespula squamosa TaxID=30214 RepID=A0ABD2AHT5_VESSQ
MLHVVIKWFRLSRQFLTKESNLLYLSPKSLLIFVTLCYSPNEILTRSGNNGHIPANFRERAGSYHMEEPTSKAPWLILPWLSNFLWRSLTSKGEEERRSPLLGVSSFLWSGRTIESTVYSACPHFDNFG